MLDIPSTINSEFYHDVLAGLTSKPKTLPCKYFYDQKGSDLFEKITSLEEYYPTRTELALLEKITPELNKYISNDTRIIEYGAGALRKVRILLDGLDGVTQFMPIDVSQEFLLTAAENLKQSYPKLEVIPVLGSFLDPNLNIPESLISSLGFFPGSTLGNLSDDEILEFFIKARKDLGENGQFLLGVDTNQSPDTLIPAYDDPQGVTASFNLNLLERANRELESNFDISSFRHEARWNDDLSRIEMHLVSTRAQTLSICATAIKFEENESIHTENSRKFSEGQIEVFASKSNWNIKAVWKSPSPSMALFLLS